MTETAPGYTKLPNIVWSLGLSLGSVAVLARLLSYAWQGDSCFPSVSTLAKDLNCSENTIRAHLSDLVSHGVVSVTTRPRHTNIYRLTLAVQRIDPDECPTTSHNPSPRVQILHPADPSDFAPRPITTETAKGSDFEPKGSDFEPKGSDFEPKGSDFAPEEDSPKKTQEEDSGKKTHTGVREIPPAIVSTPPKPANTRPAGRDWLAELDAELETDDSESVPPKPSTDLAVIPRTATPEPEAPPVIVIVPTRSTPTRAMAKPSGYSADFEALWKAYPHREGNPKARAWRAYQKVIKSGADPDVLIQAAKHLAIHHEQRDTPERYIPHTASFLGIDNLWMDFIDPPVPPAPDRRHKPTSDEFNRDVGLRVLAKLEAEGTYSTEEEEYIPSTKLDAVKYWTPEDR